MYAHFMKSKLTNQLFRVLYDMTLSGLDAHSLLFCILHLSVLVTAHRTGLCTSLPVPTSLSVLLGCWECPPCFGPTHHLNKQIKPFFTTTSYSSEFNCAMFGSVPVSVDEFPWRHSEKGAWLSSNAGWRFWMKMAAWVSGLILTAGWVSTGDPL